MTQVIINDILPLTQAIATGGQTVYSTDWTANAASDVVVYSTPSGDAPNDVTQILASNQFNVAFIGGDEIVEVTLVTPSDAGDIVTITRQTPADRENLYTNTNFTPSMLNNDFGILTLVDQQNQLVNQQVAPRYNYSALIDVPIDTILPILGANQIWAKNNDNTEIVPITISSSGSLSGIINPGSLNQLAYYAAAGNILSGLTLTQGLGISSGNLFVGQSENIQFNNGQGFQDSNGNPLLLFNVSASAVNYVELINAATGSSPNLVANGTDNNIIMKLSGKGTGGVGIQGTSTNDNAFTGYVGEYISASVLSGAAVSLSTGVNSNIAIIPLTPGDYDVSCVGYMLPNAATTTSYFQIGISTTSATFTTAGSENNNSFINHALAAGEAISLNCGQSRIKVATTSNVYLVATATFAVNTLSIYGFIGARRVR